MPTANWAQRIQQRRADRIAAMSAEEQTIRDAVNDAFPIAHVAAALGQRNRQRIYAVMERGRADQGDITNPEHTPLVYLRGAGRKDETWRAVEEALWARGWRTEHDRTTAWHAARGSAVVVFADFSTDVDDSPGGFFGYDLRVQGGRVRAKYGPDPFSGLGDTAMHLPYLSYTRVPAPGSAELPGVVVGIVGQALDGTLPDAPKADAYGIEWGA